MIAALAVAALLHVSATQAPGLAGYDLRDLDSMATRRQLDFRGIVARAENRSVEALRVVLLFAEPADSARLSTSLGYPALLWHLLKVWGDRIFASELDMVLPETRHLIIGALDRGAGSVYSLHFPRTWQLGSHDSTLPGVLSPPPATDTLVEPGRVYGPARLHRMPAIETGSCRGLVYPPALLDDGVAGRAVVELVLDSAGVAPERGIAAVSATHTPFADAAVTFLRSCHYRPGRRGPRPVATNFRIEVPFVPDSVLIRTGPVATELVPVTAVQAIAELAGIAYSQVLIRAGRGDADALRAVLRVAETLNARSPAAADYTQALEALIVRFGDRAFARATSGLSDSAKAKVSAMLDFQTEDVALHPLIAAALPPVRPPAAAPASPDTAGVLDMDLADVLPRKRLGSCRLPELPGHSRSVTLRADVNVEVVVDSSGRVDRRSVRIVTSPHIGFNEPSRDAAASCRYHPGREAGVATAVRFRHRLRFEYVRQSRTR